MSLFDLNGFGYTLLSGMPSVIMCFQFFRVSRLRWMSLSSPKHVSVFPASGQECIGAGGWTCPPFWWRNLPALCSKGMLGPNPGGRPELPGHYGQIRQQEGGDVD